MWSRSLRKQEWWNIRRTVVGVGRRDWRWSGLTWVSFPQPPPPPFRPSPVTNQIVELPTLSRLLPNILISLKLIKSPHQNVGICWTENEKWTQTWSGAVVSVEKLDGNCQYGGGGGADNYHFLWENLPLVFSKTMITWDFDGVNKMNILCLTCLLST